MHNVIALVKELGKIMQPLNTVITGKSQMPLTDFS